MNPEKENFNKMVLLTSARVFGVFFSLAIPMFLGRSLSVESYGTYKQLMLFFWFSQVALNLGLDDSAFFFFRMNSKKFPLFCFNALVFNCLVTGMLWFLMVFFKQSIASLLDNPEVADYLPLLGCLIFLTISSMQIEGMLIVGLNRFRERLIVDVSTELLKSLAIISAFYFFNSVKLALVFLCLLMLLRLLLTIIIIHCSKISEGLSYREAPKFFFEQCRYGIPLGISRIVGNILNMDNFYISHYFSLRQFTFYSVGCFENPLINATRTSMYELTNIEMIEAMKQNDIKKVVLIWRKMSRKLFLVIVPFVTYMIFFSREIILFIFSEKYLPREPVFMVFNLFLIVGALNPEPFFRATSKTNLGLSLKIIGLILGVVLIIAGAFWGGLLFALGGKILGVFIMHTIGLVVAARLLKSHFFHLFQWKELLNVILLSFFLCGLIRIFFWNSKSIPFLVLAYSFSLYAVFHFLLSCKFEIIKEDEIFHLKTLLNRSFSKVKLALKLN